MPTARRNPYEPPVSSDDEAPYVDGDDGPRFTLANRWRRLGGAIVDAILGLMLTFLTRAAMGDASNPFAPDISKVRFGAPFVIGMLVPMAIQGTLIARSGQTLGKIVMRSRIVDGDGSTAGFFQGFVLRWLPVAAVALIPSLALAAGSEPATATLLTYFTSAFSLIDSVLIFGEGNRCLHDRIAGTYVAVVGTQRPPRDEPRPGPHGVKRRRKRRSPAPPA